MGFRVGDYVTIGESTLTWQISIVRDGQALLRSGLTGRARWEPLENLKPHTRLVEGTP